MSDLAELFAKDPLQYTKEDLDAVIEGLRANRRQYNIGNTRAGKAKKTPTQKANSVLTEELANKLGDLDL